METLISHPDTIRWFIWNWEKIGDTTSWEKYFSSFFITIGSTPVDIVVTKNKISIFKGHMLNIRSAPRIIKNIHEMLFKNKHKIFKNIEEQSIFKDIKCSECIYNELLNKNIDRPGWISWSCWWLLCSYFNKWFIIIDILTVSLRSLINIPHTPSLSFLPNPPWIDLEKIKYNDNIFSCIYKRMQQDIYYECVYSLQYQRGVGHG